MPGLTIDQWGPSAWNTLHAFAHRSSRRFTQKDVETWTTFLTLFSSLLPCPKCRSHFDDFLKRRLSDPNSLVSRETLVSLLNDAHNEVNARNGKKVYTLGEHYDAYKKPSPLVMKAKDVACLVGVSVAIVLLLGAGAVQTISKRASRLKETSLAFDSSLRALM